MRFSTISILLLLCAVGLIPFSIDVNNENFEIFPDQVMQMTFSSYHSTYIQHTFNTLSVIITDFKHLQE